MVITPRGIDENHIKTSAPCRQVFKGAIGGVRQWGTMSGSGELIKQLGLWTEEVSDRDGGRLGLEEGLNLEKSGFKY
jgi:hypothetical protein